MKAKLSQSYLESVEINTLSINLLHIFCNKNNKGPRFQGKEKLSGFHIFLKNKLICLIFLGKVSYHVFCFSIFVHFEKKNFR